MEAAWKVMCVIKEIILELLDSDNDGLRTMTVKFMESVVLLQTHREPESMAREQVWQIWVVVRTLPDPS